MPELPEVHTTVEGLKKVVTGQTITDVWSDFHVATAHGERKTIKNKKYFDQFKKIATGAKILSVERRGKNILINLNTSTDSTKSLKSDPGQAYTIVIHMKMTGHLMVGRYSFQKVWRAAEKGPLQDPFNRYLHLVFSLSNGNHLVLSDMRKFASVTILKTSEISSHDTVGKLGPEPLDPRFSARKFFEIMHGKKGMPIKSALLDQTAIAGIGNIYSDEILWQTGIHPFSKADKIPENKFPQIFKVMKEILRFSIKHGGDSKSDYRNVFGEKGGFQNFHKVYGKKGQKCPKKNCSGIIERVVVRGRSAHFCPKHQIKY